MPRENRNLRFRESDNCPDRIDELPVAAIERILGALDHRKRIAARKRTWICLLALERGGQVLDHRRVLSTSKRADTFCGVERFAGRMRRRIRGEHHHV
jgi:hypothetical protein